MTLSLPSKLANEHVGSKRNIKHRAGQMPHHLFCTRQRTVAGIEPKLCMLSQGSPAREANYRRAEYIMVERGC